MSSAFIQTFTQNVPYHSDPTTIFATLCENKPNTLLLESAEISSKNSLKSLLLVNAAIKISCLGQRVRFHALTQNGAAVLPLIEQKLAAHVSVKSRTSEQLDVEFSPADNNADEDSKLLAASIFDGLRCFTELYKASPLPVFLGGLFAYDLVANFIPMKNIQLQDDGITCPDYYSPQHSDSRLLAIPTSWSRVADSNPNLDALSEIHSPSLVGYPLYTPL